MSTSPRPAQGTLPPADGLQAPQPDPKDAGTSPERTAQRCSILILLGDLWKRCPDVPFTELMVRYHMYVHTRTDAELYKSLRAALDEAERLEAAG